MAPRTREELEAMNVMDPEFKDAVVASPMPDMDSGMARRAIRANHLAALRHLYPIPGSIPEVSERLEQVPMRDGNKITVKIYQPTSKEVLAKGQSPLIVMFHEGGWSMGDLTDEDLNCRMFARDLGAVCLNVDYRLAPEHPFPQGWNDCWDTLKWAVANASCLSANPTVGFIVGGASAGGNLAAAMSQLARDEKLDPPLTGQYLCVPALCAPEVVPEKYKAEMISGAENVSDPVLGRLLAGSGAAMAEVLKQDSSSPLFSPLVHPNGLGSLPPAYLQLGGMDPLRDEGLVYERVLREEYGVPTRLDVYKGFGHMFWTNWPKMNASKKFVQDTLEGFKWLLSKPTS